MTTILNRLPLLLIVIFLMMTHMGCDGFLNKQSDDSVIILNDLQHFQAMLNNIQLLNQRTPRTAEMSADDYYLTEAGWQILNEYDRRAYTWQKRSSSEGIANDWSYAYENVFTANTVLDYMAKVDIHQPAWDNVKGQALFFRGQAFFHIATIWALAYDESTANADMGILLKLKMDLYEKVTRVTVARSYHQIISDLKSAGELLPATPGNSYNPSKSAAYAMLARVYLSMRDYVNMGIYADKCLQLKGTLKNYNYLDTSAAVFFPFAPRLSNDAEIIMESSMANTPALNQGMAKIDSGLYRSYKENDLRRSMFFKNNNDGTYSFRGSYSGSASLFSGLSTNEVYLMRAEARARVGNISAAMEDLNELLMNRFVSSTFIPLAPQSQAEALAIILTERRKELVMRGIRWIDIKRLNKEGAGIILRRSIDRQSYTLLPNDPRYARPIPEDEIRLSGIQQNPE